MLVALVGGWLLERISTLKCRYISSATYSGLALPRDIMPLDLKLVNANIPTYIVCLYVICKNCKVYKIRGKK